MDAFPRHDSHAAGARRLASAQAWWLSAGGAIALVAACSTQATNNLTASPPSTQSSPPSAATTDGGGGSSWVDASSLPPAWNDAGSAWIDSAAPAPPGFDYAAFASTIEPILDTAAGKGCTDAACHGAPQGQGGFILSRLPAAGSAQMQANFDAVKALCNLSVPDQSVFYLQATTSHDGGDSAVVSQAQASTILTWIEHAAGITLPTPPPPAADAGSAADAGAGCVSPTAFNLGVFTSEIQPILFGQLDYNAAPGQPVANNGCARSTCHGAATNPLHIATTNTPIQNLTSFGCFVNLASPSASAVLRCPLNDPACPKSPHPGQDVFASPEDLNYQRIASWLYSAQGAASPYDFAFFARQIDPIFNDPSFGGLNGGSQRTCADTSSCHGVSAAGQVPPNLSNFPILANSSSKQGFQIDYWSAAGFANFMTPAGSELFLFPTNLIANTVNQPYATGLPHPGGVDFGANDAPAQTILEWAGGLRPDGNGDVLNWLVAGTYDATFVGQRTEVGDETKIAPTIFDPDNASLFNNGVWDLLASQNEFVDFNAEFPGSPGTGRVAYAVANAINTTGSDIQDAVITVTSPNAVLLYVGAQPVGEGINAGNNSVSGIATFPSFSTDKSSTRILVKVLQRPGDTQFGFTLNLQTQQNVLLTNTSGELIFRLDPTGGI